MTAKGPRSVIVLMLAATAFTACGRARPVEPIQGILDAFRAHSIVALGEGQHGNEQSHAFRLALIRDPSFPSVVNDIVVEFGSARYQEVMDRFVSGAEVPYPELAPAWRDVAQNGALTDLPIYEEFFRAVRDVNAVLPKERHLRVLLGDPPIRWEEVATPDALQPWIRQRDAHAAALIKREVLSKNRRALVIYGDGHFARHMEWGGIPTLAGLLTKATAGSVFSIWTNTTVELQQIQSSVASWRVPSLALVKGTALGTISFTAYSGLKSTRLMQDQYDAVLYLGPPSTITFAKISRALCGDADYMSMRLSRLALSPPPPSGLATDVDRFRDECADRLRR